MYTATGKLDTTGRNDVLKGYIPLVKRIANYLVLRLPSNVSVDDMIQVGLIGLNDALERFDSSQGVALETYATQRIKGAMIDELRSSDWASRGARKTQRDIKEAIQSLEHTLGRSPKESEIANKMDISLTEYHDLLGGIQGTQMVYLEDLTKSSDEEGGGFDYLDRHVESDETPLTILTNKKMRVAVVEAIEALPEKEKQLMNLYYVDDLNMREIAAIMSITESRVCQIHSQSITRIRAKLRFH